MLGYSSELRDGLRFVRNNALVLSMVLVATVANFLDVPLLTVVMPVYAQENYGSAASFGVIVGALAAGAFLGTLRHPRCWGEFSGRFSRLPWPACRWETC
jgi:hypothetical protein